MNLTVEHFRLAREQYIHPFLHAENTHFVKSLVTEFAQELAFHVALLEGAGIRDQASLLVTLAQIYEFPKDSGPKYEGLSWNGAKDWLSDLTWITGWPRDRSKIKGFFLLYLHPMDLFSTNASEFAWFLQMVDDAAQEFLKEDLPFHLILGPIDDEAIGFIRLLRVSDRLCPSSCFIEN